MADLDALAPNYRRARDRWPNAPTLRHSHEALVACFNGNGHGMIEHVKSFIESVCVTILSEFHVSLPSSTPSTTDLLVAALGPLGLRNTRGASKLDKVLSGFNRLTDALSEMRNEHGAIAHGKDAFLDTIAADHARAFLYTGDAILSVLLAALEGREPDLTFTREPYEYFHHLNERIDRAVEFEVHIDEVGDQPVIVFGIATGPIDEAIELRVEPSRLLYGVDRSAYIEVLKGAEAVVASAVPKSEEPEDVERVEKEPGMARAPAGKSLVQLVSRYEGSLDPLRNGIQGFLVSEGLQHDKTIQEDANLTESLLATSEQNMGLDWKRREPLQAGLRIAYKRVMVRFGVQAAQADAVSERLIQWMRIQAPDTAN